MTPWQGIALSIALGVTLGVTPVLGSTTVLCLLAALVFRLNVPALQLVNCGMYPLQLALPIPFLRVGDLLLAPMLRRLGAASRAEDS
jgi:uncharacterized protein (DUF2062 family)